MKTKLLLVGVCLLLIFSCNISKDRKSLSFLKELSVNYPDSALKLLDEDFNPDLMSIDNLAKWCLLEAVIRDSLKDEMDIDTLLLERVVNYYDKNKKMPERAQAWYYYGRILDYNKSFSKAIPAYVNAIEYADEGKEYNLAGYSSSYLADLYKRNYKNPQSREYYNQAANYFEKTGNIKSKLFAYRDISNTYLREKDYENSLVWLNLIDSLSCYYEDNDLRGSIASLYANVYFNMKEYSLMENYVDRSILFLPESRKPYRLLIKSYIEREDYKKAKIYSDSLLGAPKDNHEKYLSAEVNYLLEKERGNFEDALLYYEESMKALRSQWDDIRKQEVINIERKYSRERLINKHNLAKIKNERSTFIVTALILILVILGVVAYLIFTKEKTKKQKLANDLRTKELELETKELENQKQALTIEKYKIMESRLIQKTFMFQKLKMIADFAFKAEGLMEMEFKKKVKELFKEPYILEEDWKMIREMIDECHPNFMKRLQEAKITTDKEVNLCCLLRFGFDSNQMGILLNLSKASYKSKKGRIASKLGITNQDIKLEEYLKTL